MEKKGTGGVKTETIKKQAFKGVGGEGPRNWRIGEKKRRKS